LPPDSHTWAVLRAAGSVSLPSPGARYVKQVEGHFRAVWQKYCARRVAVCLSVC